MLDRFFNKFKSFFLSFRIKGDRHGILSFHGSNKIYCKNASINVKGSLDINCSFRKAENSRGFIEMGKNSRINVSGRFRIYSGQHIILLENAILNLGSGYINRNVKIRCYESITIGNDVAISENVSIWDSDAHSINGSKMTEPVNIGNKVWIGTNCVILKGVTIGDGAVIAAGSIVNRDVEPNCLYGGIPARKIKENVVWK